MIEGTVEEIAAFASTMQMRQCEELRSFGDKEFTNALVETFMNSFAPSTSYDRGEEFPFAQQPKPELPQV